MEKMRLSMERKVKEETEKLRQQKIQEVQEEARRLLEEKNKEVEREAEKMKEEIIEAKNVVKFSQSNPPPPPPGKKKPPPPPASEKKPKKPDMGQQEPGMEFQRPDMGQLLGGIKAGVSLRSFEVEPEASSPSDIASNPLAGGFLSELSRGKFQLKKTETKVFQKSTANNDNSLMGALSRAMAGRRGAIDDSDEEDEGGGDDGSDSDWSD